ncbi:hypothetical protein CR159_12910 [Pollutimonas subterranea]|uniref:FimV N-terminal domain-containing protein n=1 Tax=Pollutimonas subterranea TaxID=2045210 RepID=A0A2N4U396_9BURK|nr:FimV/HubP family polar landmark protein [Pollutimonas subterranea]PLC49498.1 hypothetical protein CR159_12910 [Pollutimonas subterranea]
MHMSRRVSSSAPVVLAPRLLIGALAATLLMCSTAYAAGFGHSRITSKLGQPLRIDVPVKQLSADDLRSIQVSPAPAAAWVQSGLTPPVDLGTLQTRLADGLTPGSKVIQVRSTQAFDKPVADLLLDIRTASGQQRYQVSLLTHSSTMAKAGVSRSIRVRQGDTMFDIAQRHAVPGVTVYQMMIALQRENPKAFIENNLNLVKAGSTLSMPGMAQLTAISGREARRIFHKQAQAFALYRQRLAGQAAVVGQEGSAAKGVVSAASTPDEAQPEQGQRDQLRLSGSPAPSAAAGGASGGNSARTNGQGGAAAGNGAAGAQSSADVRADDRLATQKGIEDSEARVSQLERNVKDLNQALQAQGEAATGLLADGAKGLGITLPGLAGNVSGTGDSTRTGSGSSSGNTRAGADSSVAGAGVSTGTGASANSGASSNASTSPGTNGSVTGGANAMGNARRGDANKVGDSVAAATAGNAPGSTADAGSNQTRASTSDSAGATSANGAPADDQANTGQGTSSGPGTGSGTTQGMGATPDQGAGMGQGQGSGARAGGGADVGGAGTPSNGNAGPGTAGTTTATTTPSGSQATNNANGTTNNANGTTSNSNNSSNSSNNTTGTLSSPSGANGPDGVTEPISSKAEQTVSWIQEHMLGVITGLLALLVLIIAWILRRANASHDDDHPGLVTEAMVKEKLDQINLDLEHSTPDDSSTRRR